MNGIPVATEREGERDREIGSDREREEGRKNNKENKEKINTIPHLPNFSLEFKLNLKTLDRQI